MLELGVGADLLRAAGWLYVCVALAALTLAVWLPPTLWTKSLGAIAVIGVFGVIPVSTYLEAKAKSDAFKARYEVAAAKFKKLCETAGDKIYRTVENVEGIRLVKTLPEERRTTDPMWEAAAFAHEGQGASYITSFLLFETHLDSVKQVGGGHLTSQPSPNPGYKFVEVTLNQSNKVDRYSLKLDEQRKVLLPHKEPSVNPAARYGVSVEDLPETRDPTNWIAGGRIQITDLVTNEIVGEHRRFAFDPGLGSRAGQRQQWLFADPCPERSTKPFRTRFIVDQVLKPIRGDSK